MADMKSKSSDREEPEIKSTKHMIPRELINSMRNSIEKLNDFAGSTPKEVDIFGASLTPQHSYLQQLLEDPEKDVPANLRVDFHSTKVGYMTSPESLQILATQCDIDLEVMDTGLHFIEKIVAPFEQPNLPTIPEFNKTVRVQQPAKTRRDTPNREICEDTNEYLHRKNPGSIFIDSSKRVDYDTVRKSQRRRRRDFLSEYTDDFGFDAVLPNGKLLVENNDESDNESVHSVSITTATDSLINDTDSVGRIDSFKYNLSLSNYEKNALLSSTSANCLTSPPRKPKRRLLRDSLTGKFLSPDPIAKLEKTKDISSRTRFHRKEIEKVGQQNNENEEPDIVELESNNDFNLQDDDISILHESSVTSSRCETNGYHFMDRESSREVETLFRPFTEYWTYRCNFSRVKHKNFRQFEKNLPQSFHWLLIECANVVEMSAEDLYEEVCLIESYYADVLKPRNCPSTQNHYNAQEYRTKAHYNTVKKKW